MVEKGKPKHRLGKGNCDHLETHWPNRSLESQNRNHTENQLYKTHLSQIPPKQIHQGKTRIPWWSLHKHDSGRTTIPYPKQIQEKGKGILPKHMKNNNSNRTGKNKCTNRSNPPGKIQRILLSIFEEEAHRFPPSWACDHEIKLDESFVPKVGKVFPLTPWEQKAMEDFLEENLKLGRIRPSNSPQASSFFFVDKKDTDDLRPCQDYRNINSYTIKDVLKQNKWDLFWLETEHSN